MFKEGKIQEKRAGEDGEIVYKAMQMESKKVIPAWKFPVLKSLSVRGRTVNNSKIGGQIFLYLYHQDKHPRKIDSLSDQHLEVLCYEYMKEMGLIKCLLLPIGRSLPNIDVLGFNERETIFAQVTFGLEGDRIKGKIQRLFENTGESSNFKKYFYTDEKYIKTYEKLYPSIEFISINNVFKKFEEERAKYPQQHEMLN